MEKQRNRLKGLYAQKRQLEDKKVLAEKNKKEADSNLKTITDKLLGINKEIKKLEKKNIFITTHAVQRYHERIDSEKDIEQIKEEILTAVLYNMVDTLGDGKYPIRDYYVVVEDRKITTIIKK